MKPYVEVDETGVNVRIYYEYTRYTVTIIYNIEPGLYFGLATTQNIVFSHQNRGPVEFYKPYMECLRLFGSRLGHGHGSWESASIGSHKEGHPVKEWGLAT